MSYIAENAAAAIVEQARPASWCRSDAALVRTVGIVWPSVGSEASLSAPCTRNTNVSVVRKRKFNVQKLNERHVLPNTHSHMHPKSKSQ